MVFNVFMMIIYPNQTVIVLNAYKIYNIIKPFEPFLIIIHYINNCSSVITIFNLITNKPVPTYL